MESLNTKVLNEVKNLMVKVATEKCINLQDEFGTTEKFKQFVISFTIKTLVDMGVDIKDACDAVIGDGAYQQLASDVWNAAKKGKG